MRRILLPFFAASLAFSTASAAPDIVVLDAAKVVEQTVLINLKDNCSRGFLSALGAIYNCSVSRKSVGLPETGSVNSAGPTLFNFVDLLSGTMTEIPSGKDPVGNAGTRWLEVSVSGGDGPTFSVKFIAKEQAFAQRDKQTIPYIINARLTNEEHQLAFEKLTSALKEDFRIKVKYVGPEIK